MVIGYGRLFDEGKKRWNVKLGAMEIWALEVQKIGTGFEKRQIENKKERSFFLYTHICTTSFRRISMQTMLCVPSSLLLFSNQLK